MISDTVSKYSDMKRILNLFLVIAALVCLSCEPAEKPLGPENPGQTGGQPEEKPEGTPETLVRVGIMGDSISTFEGELVNDDYKFHYPCVEGTRNNHCSLSKVEQTWWWLLINEKMENGVLDVNNSFSGTKVATGSYAGLSGASHKAGFVDRVHQFDDPDVIIIHGGTNDCIKDTDKVNIGDYQWNTPLDQMDLTKFRSAYVYLVRKLQELYDGVQLILIVGDRLGADPELKYDDSIIEIAKHFNLPYVDLTPHRKVDIPVPDNAHPDYKGHAFIAQKVYDTCKDYLTADSKPEDEGEDPAISQLPADFTVTLDFSAGWPFAEELVAAEDQKASKADGGEFYNYYYKPTGSEIQYPLLFGLKRSHATSGDLAYTYADGCLTFGNADSGATYGMINVPGVEDRYITSIELTHNKAAFFTIADGANFVYNAQPNANFMSNTAQADPNKVELPYQSVPATMGGSYNIRIRQASLGISKIVVTYSATEP